MSFEPLSAAAKDWILDELRRTLEAGRSTPAHATWLDKHLDNLLWYWSVDRVRRGRVVRDAIAQGAGKGHAFAIVPHTERARAAHIGKRSKLIRRDHVVPKRVLCALVRTADPAQHRALLERFCLVAYIHVEEDARLNRAKLKQKMPADWYKPPVLERDPWARYLDPQVGIFESLRLPDVRQP